MIGRKSNYQIDEMSKVRCVGNVIISRQGKSSLITKCIDISNDGVNVISDVPLEVNSLYAVQIKAFRNGKTFLLNADALCIQSMLSSSDFKAALRFKNFPDQSEATLRKLLM